MLCSEYIYGSRINGDCLPKLLGTSGLVIGKQSVFRKPMPEFLNINCINLVIQRTESFLSLIDLTDITITCLGLLVGTAFLIPFFCNTKLRTMCVKL
jgi:hypothetical protein